MLLDLSWLIRHNLNMNAQPNLPPLPVPFRATWGHSELFKINREIEKLDRDLEDVRPRMIAKRPQIQARKAYLVARRQQIMAALGL